MSSNFNLRFAVGSPSDIRSGIWRLWTGNPPKNDVYLAPRGIAASLKVSFHESGKWQVSFTSQFVDKLVDEGDWFRSSRHLDLWNRPNNLSKNVTLAFRIIIPYSELRAFPFTLPQNKVVEWIPCPPDELSCEIALVFSKPKSIAAQWPGKTTMSTRLIANHVLPNQDILWIVYRYDDLQKLVSNYIEVAKSAIDKGEPDYQKEGKLMIGPSNRLMIGGEVADGSHFYIEVAADSVIPSGLP